MIKSELEQSSDKQSSESTHVAVGTSIALFCVIAGAKRERIVNFDFVHANIGRYPRDSRSLTI